MALDSFERVLWWLFGGTAGGANRARILAALKERPRNTQQLAGALGLDYTTVRHHLRVLADNGLLVTSGEGYGRLFFPSNTLEGRWEDLTRILEKTGRRRRADGA